MEVSKMLVVILLICLHIAAIQCTYNYSMEEDLRTEIFTTNNYNKFIRPDTTVQVDVYVSLYTLNKLDIKAEEMEVSVYFGMMWVDPRLRWWGTQYSSITSITTRVEYVWVPSVVVSNSANDLTELFTDKRTVQIHQWGSVHVQVGRIQAISCSMTVTYYPFDTQTCQIQLTVLFFPKEEIELQFSQATDPLNLNFYIENGEWELLRYSLDYEDRTAAVNYTVRTLAPTVIFRRRPLFQIVNTMLPVTLLSFVTCLVFRLPADSGEKIGFCLTVLLAFAVYLTIISENIPTTSTSTSILSIYLIVILTLGILSVLITIIVLQYHHSDVSQPIPKCLEYFTKRILIPLACIKGRPCCRYCNKVHAEQIVKQENGDFKNEKQKEKIKEDEKDLTWQEIGMIIDNVSFKISLCICIFMAVFTYIFMGIGYTTA